MGTVRGRGRRVDGPFALRTSRVEVGRHRFDKSQLIVVRTVWHKEVIDTKTEHRAASVHLLPNVIAELKKQRKQNPGMTWVFEGPRVFPLDLATLLSRRCCKARASNGTASTHSVVASVRGCTTTGRQSKPSPSSSSMPWPHLSPISLEPFHEL